MKVFIISDKKSETYDEFKRLSQDFSSCNSKECLIKTCGSNNTSTACLGNSTSSSINHNKFILISSTNSGAKNIVMQTSHNFYEKAATKFQDMIVTKNTPLLYQAYLAYWNEQFNENKDFKYHSKKDSENNLKAYFFPRKKKDNCEEIPYTVNNDCGDTYISILNNVTCTPGAKIRVAMASYTASRNNVFKKLVSLKTQGCDVKVLARESIPEVKAILGDAMFVIPYNLHSKFMLIEASYAGSKERKKIVFTGSHNFNKKSLRRNDETIIRIYNNLEVYQQYENFWNQMFSTNKQP